MASNALGDGTGSNRPTERRHSTRPEALHTELLRNGRRGVATSGEMALQGPFGHSATQGMPQRLVRLIGYCAPARSAAAQPLSTERESA